LDDNHALAITGLLASTFAGPASESARIRVDLDVQSSA
jgi:hypothetical protein